MSGRKSFYEVLGVKETATHAEIKKAYKSLSRQLQKDKSPTGKDRYKDAQHAFEVLSNPKKREWYDEFGQEEEQEEQEEDAANGGEAEDSDQDNDIFNMLGNMSMFSRFASQGSRMSKCDPIMTRVEVTLEDLYNGNTTKTAHVSREVVCGDCDGEGAKSGSKISKCDTCHGSGMKFEHHQMGLFINRVATNCSTCHGRGKVFSDEDKCEKCTGSRTLSEETDLDVNIEPGMHNMQKIEFSGVGNHLPGHIAGDVVVVLDYTEHEEFQRSHDNLVLNKTISLVEALCGYKVLVKHLDGRQLYIHNSPGEVIKSGSLLVVKNEGMPKFGRPTEKGDLLMKFSIKYPENSSLSTDSIAALKNILPTAPHFVMPLGENVEEVNMYDMEEMNFGNPFQGAAGPDEDDEDGFGGAPGGIQCHTQ
ncbi:hypothetical protein DMENIID0001_093220 [Sergentomyia squamirostris]